MLVGREHIFFVCLVGEQTTEFGSYFLGLEIIGNTLTDDLFACDDIHQDEIRDREHQRLCPTDQTDEG